MSNRKSLTGALFTAVPSLFLNLISLFVTPVIIRQLGKEHYGEWITSVSLTSIAFIFTALGWRSFFIRRIADKSVDPAIETANQLGLRGTLAIFSTMVSLGICLGLGYSKQVFYCTLVTSITFMITSISTTLIDVLQGNQDLKLLSGINSFSGLILTITSLLVVLLTDNPVILAFSYTSGPIIAILLLIFFINKNYFKLYFKFDFSKIKEYFNEVRMVSISNILVVFRDKSEQLVIPYCFGVSLYGVFSASTIAVERLYIVSSSLGDAFFGPIVRANQENSNKLFDQVKMLIIASLMLCLPIAMILCFLSPLIASILLPLNIPESVLIIRITAFILPISALLQAMNITLFAVHEHDKVAKANIWITISSILFLILFIFNFGIIGAALYQLIRPILGYFFIFLIFRHRFPGFIGKIISPKMLFCFLVMGVFLWGGSLYCSLAMEQIIQSAPWVVRKLGQTTTSQDTHKAIGNVILILSYAAMSILVFLGSTIVLKVMPQESLVKLFKRDRKQEE